MRDSVIFGRAFLDSLSMAGLLAKVKAPGQADIVMLLKDPSMTPDDVKTAERNNHRAFRIAMCGQISGSLAAVLSVSSFAYLVVHGHFTVAVIVFATWIAAILADIVWPFLRPIMNRSAIFHP